MKVWSLQDSCKIGCFPVFLGLIAFSWWSSRGCWKTLDVRIAIGVFRFCKLRPEASLKTSMDTQNTHSSKENLHFYYLCWIFFWGGGKILQLRYWKHFCVQNNKLRMNFRTNWWVFSFILLPRSFKGNWIRRPEKGELTKTSASWVEVWKHDGILWDTWCFDTKVQFVSPEITGQMYMYMFPPILIGYGYVLTAT